MFRAISDHCDHCDRTEQDRTGRGLEVRWETVSYYIKLTIFLSLPCHVVVPRGNGNTGSVSVSQGELTVVN